jgi:hypothetical protein
MDVEQIKEKIVILETKLSQLEQEVVTAIGDREIALRNQITATQNSLTELYKHLPTPGKNFTNLECL